MNHRRKIAFIYLPHNPNRTLLSTMPFAINTLRQLLQSGVPIEILSVEPELRKTLPFLNDYPNVTETLLKIDYPRGFGRATPLFLSGQIIAQGKWSTVFAVGQMGAIAGALAAKISNCPFVYINDEFPSLRPPSIWAYLEKVAVKLKDLMVVVPDCENGPRFSQLRKELGIVANVPYAEIPNSPCFAETPIIDWYERFKIPKYTKIIMHGGAVRDSLQIPELLSTLPYWPENCTLLIHGRNEHEIQEYRKAIGHLDVPGRVIWSTLPLPEAELHSLVASVHVSLALYRNSGINEELVGMSSGKLMRSLVYGTPVIASHFESLSFVSRFGLGVQVKHPSEIPGALAKIFGQLPLYRSRCREFSMCQGSFDEGWKRFQKAYRKRFGQSSFLDFN